MGLLLSITMLYLVFLTSLASAEFLSPVDDAGDVVLPEMCEEDTVISCTLVHIDLDCLNNDTLVFNDTTLTFLDQPGNDSFTFSSEDGDEATFTLDKEVGAVWGHVELADARDFIIEPLDLDSCPGCHVLIEEDRSAFPLDHKVAPLSLLRCALTLPWPRRLVTLSRRARLTRPPWSPTPSRSTTHLR